MVKDSKAIMRICQNGLPGNSDEWIPDLVHDFIFDNWDELKEILNND